MIVLYRIDDRLIHGQTMIKLIPKYPCDGIIIVNDDVAQNPKMKEIYQSVLPGSVKLHVFDVDKAMKKLPEAEVSSKRYYVITKNVTDYERLYQKGFQVKAHITVGCCSRKEGSIAVNNGFFLLPEEIDTYNRLDDAGYEFDIMTMTSKLPSSWKSFRNKLEKEEE